MTAPKCPICGKAMIKHGKTSADKQRWRCKKRPVTGTNRIDNEAKCLEEFLDWLLSKKSMADMPGGGRTFRRRTSEFWAL